MLGVWYSPSTLIQSPYYSTTRKPISSDRLVVTILILLFKRWPSMIQSPKMLLTTTYLKNSKNVVFIPSWRMLSTVNRTGVLKSTVDQTALFLRAHCVFFYLFTSVGPRVRSKWVPVITLTFKSFYVHVNPCKSNVTSWNYKP